MRGLRGLADRLRAEHRGSSWLFIAAAEAVLAFTLASTLIQFGNMNVTWSAPAAVAGGILCPVLGVLLVSGHPERYRTFGYPVCAWLADRVVLGFALAVGFLVWPAYALTGGDAHGAPGQILLVPVLTLAVSGAAVLWHHRDLLAGRVLTSGGRRAWYGRVFLAHSGPVAWRTVYQPIGTVAFVVALIVVAWVTQEESDVYALPAVATIVALVCAPVVTVSQRTATAVGMTRRAWLRHTATAVAVPTAAVLITGVLGVLGRVPSVKEMETGRMIPATGAVLALTVIVMVVAGALAGALAVAFSYEAIGAAVLWFMMINFVLTLFPQFRWSGLTQVGGAWLQVASVGLVTLIFLTYARDRVMTGRPDWVGTRIIRSRQSRQSRQSFNRQGTTA